MPPSLVRFNHIFAFVGVHGALDYGIDRFGPAALWAAVGETWFVRLQLELFRADSADFDGKRHSDSMIRRSNALRADFGESRLGKVRAREGFSNLTNIFALYNHNPL